MDLSSLTQPSKNVARVIFIAIIIGIIYQIFNF